jgi:hypothetical protein
VRKLRYLVTEVRTGAEIYYTGREVGQYLKTAFVLCDDYTELASKLFLEETVEDWSDTWTDKKGNERFKNYHAVLEDVREALKDSDDADLSAVEEIHERMGQRRKRRNDFFHSTKLLDVNITRHDCVEALCDLLDYGELLFGKDWSDWAKIEPMGTLAVMLRIEKKGFNGDPAIVAKMNDILKGMKRNRQGKVENNGAHVTVHGEDFYVRMCALYGNSEGLKTKLSALL